MAVSDDNSVQAQILKVTTKLLLAHEPDDITVRQIASLAGVNQAAVNYYFRSKDQLVEEAVLAATTTAFAQGLAILTDKVAPPRERLIRFFVGYANGLVEFEVITRTAFRSFLLRAQSSDRYASLMQQLLEETAAVFRELGHGEEAAGKKALALYSGVAFPFLALEAMRKASGIDYANDSARSAYVASLVEALVA